MDAAILEASTDSVFPHRAWLGTPRSQSGVEGLRSPLLADKSCRLTRAYGVLLEDAGVALRGLFLIDPDGVVQYAVTQNMNTGRPVDETLRVLAASRRASYAARTGSRARRRFRTHLPASPRS